MSKEAAAAFLRTELEQTAVAAQALADAGYAQDDADSAITLAGSKTRVFYQTTTPTATAVGDLWYDTTVDGNSRISYRPRRWSGTAWDLVDAPALIVASEIAAGAIVADKIAAGELKTSNYAQDGSGNPTAGAIPPGRSKVAPGSRRRGPKSHGTGHVRGGVRAEQQHQHANPVHVHRG
jgi:hypothetical protein